MWSKISTCNCTGRCAQWAPLVLRLALGAIFTWHGYDKVVTNGVPAIGQFLASLGFPAPDVFAYILSYGELAAGILLILGLFTHWAAKFAVVVGVVAFFTVHWKNGFAVGGAAYGYEYIMLITAAALSVMTTGAGKYSLDEMWMKKRGSNETM